MSEADREHHTGHCYICEDMQIRLSVSEDAEQRNERLRSALQQIAAQSVVYVRGDHSAPYEIALRIRGIAQAALSDLE